MQPKVSVIIPCYNQGIYLNQALNSVLNQTYKDYEVIIINDGSDDTETLNFLNKITHPKVEVFNQNNNGVCIARNIGASKSKGEFILFLDGDDWIGNSFLEEAVILLENNSDLKIIGSGVQYFGFINEKYFLPEYSPQKHLQQNLFFITSLIRKESFEKQNGFDEAFSDGWEDWDLFLRLINNEKQVHIIKKYLLHYRIKKESRNAHIKNDIKTKLEQQLFQKHIALYLKYYPSPIELIRNYEHNLREINQFEIYKHNIFNSFTYKLSKTLLLPFRWIKRNKNA